jgi:hypothetical protein
MAIEIELLPHQKKAIQSKKKKTCLLGGLGCIHDSALLETIEGAKNPSEIKHDTQYKTFNGLYYKFSPGTAPFLKGVGDLYRVIHEQGEFVAFGRHLTFFSDYNYLSLEKAFLFCKEGSFLQIPLVSISGDNPLTPFLDVHCSLKAIQDSLYDYLMCNHSCDGQPRRARDIDLGMFPSLDDVLKFYRSFYSLLCEHKDDFLVQGQEHSHHANNVGQISKLDFYYLLEGLILNVEDLISSYSAEHISLEFQSNFLFLLMIFSRRIDQLFSEYHISTSSTSNKNFNKILHIEKAGQGEYWDLKVENTNNYIANNAIHHNSGKTMLGAVWTLVKLQEDPMNVGLITANTYGQLQKSTLESCFKLYDQVGIPWDYNKQLSVLTLAGTKRFLCLSTENYDTHRGIEVAQWWGDEAAYYSLDAYKVLSGRVRTKFTRRDILFTTTPKGMNWIYDYFHPMGEKHKEDVAELIIARTRDNIHLPEDYETTLRHEYGEMLSKQELDAEFVKLGSGMAYYAFGDKNLMAGILKRLGDIVWVGLDFNVNPYCALLCHFVDNNIECFDEIYLENSNTPEMIKSIKEKVKGCHVRIIPDSTQFKRSTLGITDIEMLKQEFEVIHTRNPFVIDRVNNVNRLFELGKIRVNPACRHLINDLNKVTWREKTLELDQISNKMLTHMSDALGYVCWQLLPFMKQHQARSGYWA